MRPVAPETLFQTTAQLTGTKVRMLTEARTQVARQTITEAHSEHEKYCHVAREALEVNLRWCIAGTKTSKFGY